MMSTALSESVGRYSVTLTPLVTSCTAVPTELTLAPYLAASALSTSSFQSMPGSGRPSSRSRIAGIFERMAATFLAAAGSLSGSSAESCTCTGLPVGGPARGAVTSTRMPGMSRVSSRISSMMTWADWPRLPVGEFVLDDADGVLGDLA